MQARSSKWETVKSWFYKITLDKQCCINIQRCAVGKRTCSQQRNNFTYIDGGILYSILVLIFSRDIGKSGERNEKKHIYESRSGKNALL